MLPPLEDSAMLPTSQGPPDFQIHRACWKPLPGSTCLLIWLQGLPLWKALSFFYSEWIQYNSAHLPTFAGSPSYLLFFFPILPHGSSLRVQTHCFFHKEPFQNQSLPQHPIHTAVPTTPTKLLLVWSITPICGRWVLCLLFLTWSMRPWELQAAEKNV